MELQTGDRAESASLTSERDGPEEVRLIPNHLRPNSKLLTPNPTLNPEHGSRNSTSGTPNPQLSAVNKSGPPVKGARVS